MMWRDTFHPALLGFALSAIAGSHEALAQQANVWVYTDDQSQWSYVDRGYVVRNGARVYAYGPYYGRIYGYGPFDGYVRQGPPPPSAANEVMGLYAPRNDDPVSTPKQFYRAIERQAGGN